MPSLCSPRLSCFPPLLSCFSAGQPGGGPARSGQQQRNNKQLPGPEPLLPEDWDEGDEQIAANGGEAFSPFSAPQQQNSAREPQEQSRSLSSSSLTASSEPGVGEPGSGAAANGSGAHRASGGGSTFLSPFTCLAAPATACFSGGQGGQHGGGRAAAVNCLPAMRHMGRRHGDVKRLPGPLSPLPEDEPLADDQPTVVNGWVPTLEELMAAEDVTYRTGYSRTSPAPSTLADEFCSFTTTHSAMNSPSPSLCRNSPNTAAAAAAAASGGAPSSPLPHALHRSPTSNSVHSSSGIGVVKQNSCGSESSQDSGLSFCGPPGSSRFHLPLPPSTPSGSLNGVSSVGEYGQPVSGPSAYEQDVPNPVLQHVPSVGTLRMVPSKGNLGGALPSRATSLTTAREGSRMSLDGSSEVNADGQVVGRSSSQGRAAAPEQVQLDDEETASQQADRLYTHEVLENFRTQPPHPEPRSGVVFPGMCCDINLAGVGVRAKRLFGAEIIVYALGAYVDGEGARRELTEAHARNPSRDTLATEYIISETMSKAIRIVMTLSVSQSQFMGALEERLVPPLKAAKAMHLLDKLRALLSGVTFGKGTEIVLSTVEGGVLTIMVNGETKGVVQSLLLCRSLYDVWLGKESVAPDLRESFLDTMEKLISTPRN